MVTLRAFSNQAQAALAKSVLEDHNIVCALADESAHLLSGAQFAMPVRLLVPEAQAEEAAQILENGGRDLPDAQTPEPPPIQDAARDNPWEVAGFALLVALPGIALLLQKSNLLLQVPRRMDLFHGPVYGLRRSDILVISPGDAHVMGWIVVAIALGLIALYFYLRRTAAREQAMNLAS